MNKIEQVIKERKTTKVFSSEPLPVDRVETRELEEMLEVARFAPFHLLAKDCHLQDETLNSVVPWRFYALSAPTCRKLATVLREEHGDKTKVPMMLDACDFMVITTWLPNPGSTEGRSLFEGSRANMEHIAAASAAVQNLLISATARDYASYWSTGGMLRNNPVMEFLSIPTSEILLGAVFLSSTTAGATETVAGKHRDSRGTLENCMRWVSF